ncbi:MAG TPA: hypothetical protein VHK91_05595, partial [Flavisolibacter sp.]|nr:hypothetical protein [Flavisolibacter sp.]
SNKWIRDAELYFDRENQLHVSVDEREPIARLFTTLGASFYMDSSGHQMPLLEKFSARVPVITGFTAARKGNEKDSAFLEEVKKLAWYVYTDPFWNAQIGQIDITQDRKFELVPVIGDHLIRIGNAENLEDKLHRLLLFYQKVLSKVGFNRYSVVDVQFDGQVIGVNKGETSRVDSLQLQKNIEELLKRSTIQNVSDDMLPGQNTVYIPKRDSTVSKTAQNNSVAMKTTPDPIVTNQTNSNPVKRTNPSRSNEKPVKKVKKTAIPKAVMKKKN